MALKYLGERFVIALNQLGKSATIGDTYRVFNDGHLDLGRLNVERGNFVSWNGSGWQIEKSIRTLNTLDLGALPATADDLPDCAGPDVPNNAISHVVVTEAAVTFNVNVGPNDVPNFAIEIECNSGSTTTIAVQATDANGNVTALKKSVNASDTLVDGSYYQLTCVGSCWTIAEFA